MSSRIYHGRIINTTSLFPRFSVLLCLFMMFAATGCGSSPADSPAGTPTVILSPSGAPDNAASVSPLPSEPTQAPPPSSTPSPSGGYDVDAAEQLIRSEIISGQYLISLLSDSFELEAEHYYTFVITKNGSTMEPLVLVGQKSGELKCISGDGSVSEFSSHPLYRVPLAPTLPPSPEPTAPAPTDGAPSRQITPDEALHIFRELTVEQTGLAGSSDSYLFYINEELTSVLETDCYTILAYSLSDGRLYFEALFYITSDGSTIYRQTSASDELEIFSLH